MFLLHAANSTHLKSYKLFASMIECNACTSSMTKVIVLAKNEQKHIQLLFFFLSLSLISFAITYFLVLTLSKLIALSFQCSANKIVVPRHVIKVNCCTLVNIILLISIMMKRHNAFMSTPILFLPLNLNMLSS